MGQGASGTRRLTPPGPPTPPGRPFGVGPTGVEVIPVTPDRAKEAAFAAARGFQENEVWKWVLPNDRTRARVERRHYRSLVKHIFVPRRSAWMTSEATGAALWFPPGTMKLSFREALAEGVPFMPEGLPRLAMVGRLDAAKKKHHPKEPYWYLSVLSVSPESQGLGHGSALIQPGLDSADAAGTGAWLETQRESNVGFYERFGFELVTKVMIDEVLPIWMMWRKPRSG